MNIATLTLEWARGSISGWSIKICGPNITSGIDLSEHNFVKFTTIQNQNSKNGRAEPDGWEITPAQNPALVFYSGNSQREPPMGSVAEYLQILHSYGYRIVGTHSLCTGVDNYYPVMAWTLQK